MMRSSHAVVVTAGDRELESNLQPALWLWFMCVCGVCGNYGLKADTGRRFFGGTGAQQLSLTVYAHPHTPDGDTEAQQHLSVSLSLYVHPYTPGERVAGW